MTETCNFGGHIKKGNFEINNNAWSGGTTQCVYDTPAAGWHWVNTGSGVNYPSIVVGTNFCSWASTWSKFPIQWKNITSWNITVEWNYPQQPNGDWNLSFDIYLWDTSNCGGDSNKKMNNMVWIQGGGGLFSQSGSTVIVDGLTYYLDDPAYAWPRHNFMLKNSSKGAGTYTVDLKKLLATQSGLNGNWYIDGIHFGNEYGSNSSGETHITKYAMEMNGETISMVGSAPVTRYKCSGAPNYTCTAVTDGTGTYGTLAECQASCRAVNTALVFEDNFDGTTINGSKWPNVYTNPTWWPNTSADSKNASVSNGQLHLKLSVGGQQGRNYTGTGLENVGVADRAIGYWESRARFPQGNLGSTGYLLLWPTNTGWPPEVDFAETTGNDANYITFTQHWSSGGHQTQEASVSNIDITQFHTYGVELTTDNKMKWYVDGVLKATQDHHSVGTKWCFAAGLWAGDCSGWGGCPDSKNFPQYLDIDYVRVYDSKPAAATNSITVTSPNGGETWQRGTKHNVTWTSTGSPGANVKIELLKAGTLVGTVTSNTPNDGLFSWTLSSASTYVGTDFKIRITSTTNSVYTDTSNSNFVITPAATNSITVTSPNGGETWQRGTKHNVTWTSTGSPGANVKIELLKAGTLVGTVTSNTPNDGLFSWTISSGRAHGTDYKIRITSTTNPIFTDTSNSNFTILSAVPVKKFDVYSVGNNSPNGAMAITNEGGLYTADETCQQVCNILKNIT